MKPIKINKKSWHYELATGPWNSRPFYDYDYDRNPMDICKYRNRVLAGFLINCLIAALIALAVLPVVDIGVWLLAGFLAGFTFPQLALLGFVELATLLAVFLSTFFEKNNITPIQSVGNYMGDKLKNSVVSHMYRSWKDKYCVPVEFE